MVQKKKKKKRKEVFPPQEVLLRDAMTELGMTRAEFAIRLSVPVRTLDKWLLPEESDDGREMSDMARAYILEILEWHRKTA